jgi:hypothetical protein
MHREMRTAAASIDQNGYHRTVHAVRCGSVAAGTGRAAVRVVSRGLMVREEEKSDYVWC